MSTTTEQPNALATREPTRLSQLTGFSDAQINLIRNTVALGANITEVAWFLYNANKLGFEPNLKQIYLIKYGNNPAEIVVGVDGYRKQAADSGEYAGSDEPVYEYDPSDTHQFAAQKYRAPSKCTVTVYRLVKGVRVPFTASVRWTEFYPGDGKAGEQYRKRPHNQMAVRAETHAIRKGFPHQTERLDERRGLPSDWQEAADRYSIEQQIPPAQRAALAATYDRIAGADEQHSYFDLPQEDRSAHAAPAERQEDAGADGPPASSPADDKGMVNRARHPLNHKLAERIETASALGIDTQPYKTPVPSPVSVFEGRIAELERAILAAEGASRDDEPL